LNGRARSTNQNSSAVCRQKSQQPQDIPRVMEIAKKFWLEFLPPPGA